MLLPSLWCISWDNIYIKVHKILRNSHFHFFRTIKNFSRSYGGQNVVLNNKPKFLTTDLVFYSPRNTLCTYLWSLQGYFKKNRRRCCTRVDVILDSSRKICGRSAQCIMRVSLIMVSSEGIQNSQVREVKLNLTCHFRLLSGEMKVLGNLSIRGKKGITNCFLSFSLEEKVKGSKSSFCWKAAGNSLKLPFSLNFTLEPLGLARPRKFRDAWKRKNNED